MDLEVYLRVEPNIVLEYDDAFVLLTDFKFLGVAFNSRYDGYQCIPTITCIHGITLQYLKITEY